MCIYAFIFICVCIYYIKQAYIHTYKTNTLKQPLKTIQPNNKNNLINLCANVKQKNRMPEWILEHIMQHKKWNI